MRRRFQSHFHFSWRSLASAVVAGAGVLLGAVPLVWATPPAPAPTTFFGIPIPTSLPAGLPSGFPAMPGLPTIKGLPTFNPAQLPYWSPQHVLVLPASADIINPQILARLLSGKSDGCGANEVAPGEYVKIDCRPYAQILGAVKDVFDPAKLDLLTHGQLHVEPNVAPVAPGPSQEPGREGMPAAIDHRTMGLEGPIKDQGLVGNCSAFSLSSVIDNAILRMHKSDVISPEHLWAHYGNSDMGQAGDSNLNKLIALNQTWPYSMKQACELVRDPNDECGELLGVTPASASSDATLQGQFRTAEQNGVYKIASIERITHGPNANVATIAAVLATGADVWAGFDVDVASWKSTSQVNNVIRDWSSTNGGHAVALAGYREAPDGTGRQFLVHNSWGGRWGDHGFAWVNESMLKAHLQVAYKVTVVDPRTPRTGPQTDDDCDSGALVDARTGACAAVCPGGRRRTGGQCR
jgi:hypothetical protein